jgi:hypothetical protein
MLAPHSPHRTLRAATACAVGAGLAMSACAFEPIAPGEAEEPAGDDPPGPIASPPSICASQPAPVMCFDFEPPAMVTDRVTPSVPTMARDVAASPRLDGQALTLTDKSDIRVQDQKLDVSRLTLDVWVYLDQKPSGRDDNLAAAFDATLQYALAFTDQLRVRCSLGFQNYLSETSLRLKTWHHVACRYDGARLRIYIDGDVVGCAAPQEGISRSPTYGATIGSRYSFRAGDPLMNRLEGSIDNLRLFDVPLTDDALCTAAGKARGTCRTTCPDG